MHSSGVCALVKQLACLFVCTLGAGAQVVLVQVHVGVGGSTRFPDGVRAFGRGLSASFMRSAVCEPESGPHGQRKSTRAYTSIGYPLTIRPLPIETDTFSSTAQQACAKPCSDSARKTHRHGPSRPRPKCGGYSNSRQPPIGHTAFRRDVPPPTGAVARWHILW